MQATRKGKRGGAGECIALDSVRSAVLYPSTVGGSGCFPPAGDHARHDFPVTANPLSQATSSPKLPHSFDGTEVHARDAPRRVLSCVLFRGVVTPGLGIDEGRAFFVDSNRHPQSNQGQDT